MYELLNGVGDMTEDEKVGEVGEVGDFWEKSWTVALYDAPGLARAGRACATGVGGCPYFSGEDGTEADCPYSDVGRRCRNVVEVRGVKTDVSQDGAGSRGFGALFHVESIISRVLERRYRDGGEERRGWLDGNGKSGSVDCLVEVSNVKLADLGMGK
jgi:hypothetical protein